MKDYDEIEMFRLDPNKLPEYWLEQSDLYHFWAIQVPDAKEALGHAEAEKEVCKAELKKVDAEIDRDIRNEPSRFGIEKITEPAIERAILLDNRHQKAQTALLVDAENDVIAAQHKVDILYAWLKSLDVRKESLQDLVKLDGRDQFSKPRAEVREDRERMNEVEKQHDRTRARKKADK